LLQMLDCPIANRLCLLSKGMMAPFSSKEITRTYSVLRSAVDDDKLSGPHLVLAERLISFFSREYPWCCEEERRI
jgi:hypothetical protein